MINMAAVAMRSAAKKAASSSVGNCTGANALRHWHGAEVMGKDVLALICPDWCDTALVLNAPEGHVAYANWRCLNMLERRTPAWLADGRLVFQSSDFNARFYSRLEETIAGGSEVAVLVGHEERSVSWFSVTIRNAQGLFRDVLERKLGNGVAARCFVIVEFAMSGSAPEPAALMALAEACSLAPAEAELVGHIAQGLSLEDIAQKRGIALSTVRQRLKAVLAKTRCHRQSELVHLVMSLCPSRPPWSNY